MTSQLTKSVILTLSVFTIFNVYLFVQNYSQNTYVQEVKRTLTIYKDKVVDAKSNPASSENDDKSNTLAEVDKILKRLQTLESNRQKNDFNNKTMGILERLVNKVWSGGSRKSEVDDKEDANLNWLNRTKALTPKPKRKKPCGEPNPSMSALRMRW